MSRIASEYDHKTAERFLAYHAARRDIFEHFKSFAVRAYESGKKLSAKAIMERLRWEVEIERRGDFKITNSATALYARALAAVDPRFENYFQFKPTKGVKSFE